MKEIMTGKTYSITVPENLFGEVVFNSVTNTYKIVDKDSNLGRMSNYQLELSCLDNYYAAEDEIGALVLFKVKDYYIIEENFNE